MTPQRLLTLYERGVIANGEMVYRICNLSAEFDPATFADQVPTERLADIRELTERIPKPENVLILQSVCRAEPADRAEDAARERHEKERYVAGLQAWKAYYDAADRPE